VIHTAPPRNSASEEAKKFVLENASSDFLGLLPAAMAEAVLAARLQNAGANSESFQCLAEPVAALHPELDQALTLASRYLEARLRESEKPDDAFSRIIRAFHLAPLESDLLLLSLWPHLDERLGAALQAWTGLSTPLRVRDIIGALIPSHASRHSAVRLLGASRLWDGGILRGVDATLSVFDRALQPTPALIAAWNGLWPRHLETGAEIHWVERESGMESCLEVCPRFAAGIQAGVSKVGESSAGLIRLVLTSPSLDPTTQILEPLSLLAQALQCKVFYAIHREGSLARTLREVEILALLTGALPCLIHAPIHDEPLKEKPLGPIAFDPTGPFLWFSHSNQLRLESRQSENRHWTLPRLRADERSALWRHLVEAASGSADYDVLGLQAGIPYRIQKEAVSLALRLAKSPDKPSHSSLSASQPAAVPTTLPASSTASFEHQHLASALASLRPPPVTSMGRTQSATRGFDSLIIDREAREQLHRVASRLRNRVEVEMRWGLGGNEDTLPGLTVLLHGESGTGKTLAAEALAHSVSLPLLCADLSQVVSKYIGETEKQIEQLLRAAEGYRAVLFFDEADALFGKRTGVRDSHDRYANIEVDFLLQRLERFEGLVVLATNLMQNLDEAFLRRIHLAVHLARPNPALRRKLWQIHFPTQQISEDIDFDALSRRYDMVGGDIRNVAVDASYRAAAVGSKISWAHLQTALQEDFRKKGRPTPQP
jgi:hypothetical protein